MSATALSNGRSAERHRVGHAVVAERVALGKDALHQRRMRRRIAPDREEGGVHALIGQRLQHLGRGARQRTVIEGEHHLAVSERQGLREVLGADLQPGRIDRQHAFGAELAGTAGSVRAA